MTIEYLKNETVAKLINDGEVFQKSALTGLRLPTESEIGQDMITYVNHEGQIRKESSTKITKDVVLAKNLNSIGLNEQGKEVFNEWPIPMVTAVKNYGQEVVDNLSHETFTNHKKKATLKGIVLTPEVMTLLGVSGDTLEIKVSWSDEPMMAKVGDVITDGGYSVSKHDMQDYEKVSLNKSVVLDNISQLKSSIEKKSNHTFKP